MSVADLVFRDPSVLHPNDSLRTAAEALALAHADLLPVCDRGRLVGALSERDLVDHGLARGLNPDAPVLMAMSQYFDWCYLDETTEIVAARFRDADIETLLVVDRHHRLVGVIARQHLTPEVRDVWAATDLERQAA